MNNSQLEHSHEPDAIARRLDESTRHSYLRDFVYGATDGIVTTFAVVMGVAGAQLSSDVVILLGAANLVADGFSMAASNYLGTRTDEQVRESTRAMEVAHIHLDPEGEKEEIRQIFKAKGFDGTDLDKAVDIITRNHKQWVDTMLVDEHGLALDGPSPIKAAVITFLAFVLVGILPLLPFLWFGLTADNQLDEVPQQHYIVSTVLTGIAFFLVGASKSLFIRHSWLRSGMETFVIGSVAAILAYGIGFLLHQLVGTG